MYAFAHVGVARPRTHLRRNARSGGDGVIALADGKWLARKGRASSLLPPSGLISGRCRQLVAFRMLTSRGSRYVCMNSSSSSFPSQSSSPSSADGRDASGAAVNVEAAAASRKAGGNGARFEELGEDSNLAARQVDDGSLSAESSFVPQPLFRKDRFRVPKTLKDTVILGLLFGVWYYSNTVFNVYNKQVLKVYPYAWTCTFVQFFVASITMSSLWVTGFKETPHLSRENLKRCVPLGVLHMAGFLLTNMSLGAVSVAFTHTVKATEPFFSVALSPSMLGEVPTWGILGSLFPIVAGVVLASANEASFTWFGFLSALGSNLALQSRNVYSKRFLKKGTQIDNINLFAVITIVAMLIMAPLTLLIEGFKLGPQTMAASGFPAVKLWRMLVLGGLMRCADVLASYMILNRVSPVTHSVGNCVKRAVVIVMSVIVFRTPLNWLNIVGTVTALLGVLVYSLMVVGCKQNYFGPDHPLCQPIFESFEDGAGI
ncbi:Phosphoenolpyruvate/phosphate translocator 2, chloroplastic [Porphyridium purpureum]|uniref:Phosphoenolpyruvate/phosphate translocator 2, chloroplastic n=1 Tax=Porphyridium purpureum TaxID=35688 RepID=A0A5J4YRU1_PORPP|nr:Phosphoenolpyruvate/phosphate translocator 2, chloroplastic [Porphyridium purpureum]|eukprot:POR2223..scf229_5